MTQDQSDICRAEFEKWFKNKFGTTVFEKYANGGYMISQIQSAYIPWKACYERFSKPATEHNPADKLESSLNRLPKPLPELKKLMEKPKVWDADNSQNVEYNE